MSSTSVSSKFYSGGWWVSSGDAARSCAAVRMAASGGGIWSHDNSYFWVRVATTSFSWCFTLSNPSVGGAELLNLL